MTLARGGAAGQPDPGPPPAHHAQPDPGLPRRRTGASPAARPAATSRTSGSSSCCCPISSAGCRCRRRSRRRAGTATRCRARSTRARPTRASWWWRPGSATPSSTGSGSGVTGWSWSTSGRSAGCPRSAGTRRPACSEPAPTPGAAGLRGRPLTDPAPGRTRRPPSPQLIKTFVPRHAGPPGTNVLINSKGGRSTVDRRRSVRRRRTTLPSPGRPRRGCGPRGRPTRRHRRTIAAASASCSVHESGARSIALCR